MRHFLSLSYDGTPWHGWQRQPEADSVQAQLERALSLALREQVSVVGAGRTDAGVHAEQQWAHFDHAAELPPTLLQQLNGILPHSIAVHGVWRPRAEALHARFDALSRSYRYQIVRSKNPFAPGRCHRYDGPLELDALGAATALLHETDDFASFCKSGADNGTTRCQISEARWHAHGPDEQPRLDFHITANRFLRGMVRALVGTLLDVGRGQLSVADFASILEARDRRAAGPAAPPEGLYLSAVAYPAGALTKIMPNT